MEDRIMKKDYTIAVAGTGYVGWRVYNRIYREFYVICSIFYFAVMGISKRITW